MKYDLSREMFKSWRNTVRKNRTPQIKDPSRGHLDDPQTLSNVLKDVVTQRDWTQGIAEGTLFSDWQEIVGDDVALHATPITIVDGKLTIQTTSTAWATQLRLIQSQLLKTISSTTPGALVEELIIIGPHTPSWKKGLRTIRNARGPRDTYG
jgi:predicted nucleic acid-binding Zn ribbon protein